jgi:peptidoglycan/LPS O-acetylase OafA/YrhL
MREDGWDQLDTVRLVLALIVVIAHVYEVFALPMGLDDPILVGGVNCAAWLAVLAFFVISGLVIGRSLITTAADADWLFVRFMRRRILRIYPPLLFSVVVVAILAMILRSAGLEHYVGDAPHPARTDFSYLNEFGGVVRALLTFGFRGGLTGSSNGPLWSLVLEMQAYVVIGLLAQILVAKSLPVRAMGAVALLFAARGIAWIAPNGDHMICFAAFAAGAALNFFAPRFPKILPVVLVDCSYSLYILHFPIMLFIFFVVFRGPQPSISTAILWAILSVFAVIFAAIFSGYVFERRRARPRSVIAQTA